MPCIACGRHTGTYIRPKGECSPSLRICGDCLKTFPDKKLRQDELHGVYRLHKKNGHAYIDVIEVEDVQGKNYGGTIIHFMAMTPNAWLRTRVSGLIDRDDRLWQMSKSEFMKCNPHRVTDEELPTHLGLDTKLDEAIGRRLNR